MFLDLRVNLLFLVFILLFTASMDAQTISQFDFNSTGTIKNATTGPNAVFVSPAAVAPAGVAYITTGCGAGIGMDVTVPGSTFDVTNIRVRANFKRGLGENTGSFFRRGAFDFGFRRNGKLVCDYRISNGAGGFTDEKINANVTVSITQFDEYEFTYDNCSGIATIRQNGVIVKSKSTGLNKDLYWTGTGDGVIGSELDNACSQIPGYDYVIIGGNDIGCLILPVEWGDFTGEMTAKGVALKWSTLMEKNTDKFIVERSTDGQHFETVMERPAAGNTENTTYYEVLDRAPSTGITFYKVRQIDLDGKQSQSEVIQVVTQALTPEIKVFPNPSQGNPTLTFREMPGETIGLQLYDLQGRLQKKENLPGGPGTLETTVHWQDLPAGIYWLTIRSGNFKKTEKLIIQ